MMITQGGTGSGTSGPAVRKIWEHLYGIKGEKVNPTQGRDPRHHATRAAADLRPRRVDPAAEHQGLHEGRRPMTVLPMRPALDRPQPGRRTPASTGCCSAPPA